MQHVVYVTLTHRAQHDTSCIWSRELLGSNHICAISATQYYVMSVLSFRSLIRGDIYWFQIKCWLGVLWWNPNPSNLHILRGRVRSMIYKWFKINNYQMFRCLLVGACRIFTRGESSSHSLVAIVTYPAKERASWYVIAKIMVYGLAQPGNPLIHTKKL